jgi:beta-galactosidase
VDENSLVRLGGFPGGLLHTLGCRVEEFHPLPDDVTVGLSDGGGGRLWSEHVRVGTAEVISSYHGGALDGLPAVTRHRHGAGRGVAWYVSTRPDEKTLTGLVHRWLTDARVRPVLPGLPDDVVAVRRVHPDGRSWLFVINHGRSPVDVSVAGVDVLSGMDAAPGLRVPPHGFAVIRQ